GGDNKGRRSQIKPEGNHGSLNRYKNSHPLRERARKLSQGILIIRFEMPYNIWCEGCKNHIGMGVRYNAEKKKVGNYYTTPIYRFRMKCHLCVNYIEMQTDPANCDYVIVSGAERKEERWDMSENEQILTTEHEQKQKLETDSMFRLEHGVADKEKLQRAVPSLSELQEVQSAWKDDFSINSLLRSKFREKKHIKEEEERDQAFLRKASLDLKLLPETDQDQRLAALLRYRSVESYEERQKKKRSEISSRPWFAQSVDRKPQIGSALKKLGVRPKAQSSPTTSSLTLSLVRRGSKVENKGESQGSPSEAGGKRDIREGCQDQGCVGEDEQNEKELAQVVNPPSIPPRAQTPVTPPASASCLVPAYSDSSSESEEQ
uniref:Probable splicing factor YJU2B n=1 Tax=Leptobrachium leishanense TaxID=445787 RepID=A0A8C5MYE2_9ANUR